MISLNMKDNGEARIAFDNEAVGFVVESCDLFVIREQS